jgi:hypothetical protein
MGYRAIAFIAALCATLPTVAWGQDYDFQDTSEAIHYITTLPFSGPGVLPSTHEWTGFLEPDVYTNNGVTLDLTGFPIFAIPNFGVDIPDPYEGMPGYVLSQAISSNQVVAFSLGNVPTAPAGMTYDLVLYATNFQANAGTAFALTSGSGSADGGISQTINAPDPGQMAGPDNVFQEGVNYMVFDNVVPVGGVIGITATPLSTEADLNGVQLVAVAIPEPGTLALAAVGAVGLVARRRVARRRA